MTTWRRVAASATALGALATGAAAAMALRHTGTWAPGDREPIPVRCAPDAPVLQPGQALKVLVWNVQFAGSRKHWFFYDGGDAVHVPPGDVAATLDAIAAVIRAEQPDVVLLQEVDRGSDRTGRVDEHAELLARVPFACDASAPYHQVAYVPHPPEQHLGRVDMHLSVFSRYQLGEGVRTQLALLHEPWWRQLFNLRRALMEVRLPLGGGGELVLLQTHLSAFSGGDGTLAEQVAALDAAMTEHEAAGRPVLLAGDFNALPPGDAPARLGAAGEGYEAVTPVLPLFERFTSVATATMHRDDPLPWRTYLPPHAAEPDRAIDHAFLGRRVALGEAKVVQDTTTSDHMPLVLTITPRP